MKCLRIVLASLLFLLSATAKDRTIDSLNNVLHTNIPDTTQVLTLCVLAQKLQYTDTSFCRKSLQKALNICEKIKYDYGFGFAYYQLGSLIETSSADYDTAKKMYESAYHYYKKALGIDGQLGMALALSGLSNIGYFQTKYEESVNFNLAAIEIYKKINTDDAKLEIANQYVSIGQVYHRLKQFQKSVAYFEQALQIRKNIPYDNSNALTQNYLSLAYNYTMLDNFGKSKTVLKTVELLLSKNNIPELKMEYYEILGSIEYRQQNYNKAIDFYFISLEEAKKTGNIHNIMIKNFMIGQALEKSGNFNKATKFYKASLPDVKKTGDQIFELKIYQNLTTCKEKTGQIKEAYNYLKLYSALNDSMQKEKAQVAINDIETKYQSLQKEKQIIELEKEKQFQQLTLKQNNTLIYALIGGLTAIVLFALLYYKNSARKQLLAQQTNLLQLQKIKELEQEKQLMAIDKIIQIQEAERTRMAKDLHDGLGGMLSGIKLNLSSMKGNIVIQEQDVSLFNKSISQLDNAISEMRRVAHNMMPEALLKFGLTEAIQDYCDGINESNTVKLKFTNLGLTTPLEKSVEVILYRIIQELTNNAIKHASAKNILVQLSKNENILNLTVEDDGKGFDTKQLANIKGTGLQNVHSRVDYLKGSLEIQSSIDGGTSVIIEIPI